MAAGVGVAGGELAVVEVEGSGGRRGDEGVFRLPAGGGSHRFLQFEFFTFQASVSVICCEFPARTA